MDELRVNDLFCCGGGMGIAFKQAGWTIAGAMDWDGVAVESYNHNVGNHAIVLDIKKATHTDMADADCWAFGFPCQDLSRAGSGQGLLKGKKSKMFFEVMRLLHEMKEAGRELPRTILAENVPGLDKYMDVLREEYDKAGYRTHVTKVVSKYWGIPQNRERRYVVGVRKDLPDTFTFAEQQTIHMPKLRDFMQDKAHWSYYVSHKDFPEGFIEFRGDHYIIKQATKKGYIEAYPGDSMNVAFPDSKSRRGRVGKQIAQTFLTSKEQLYVTDDMHLRWFTPRELARLQGFPDDYEIIVSPSKAHFLFGNAVTINVARSVAERIKDYLESI